MVYWESGVSASSEDSCFKDVNTLERPIVRFGYLIEFFAALGKRDIEARLAYFAAFHQIADGEGGFACAGIAYLPVGVPSSQQPSFLGRRYQVAIFCDWTEDGRILAYVANGGGPTHLVILDRGDRLMADIPGGATMERRAGTAAWRNYLHR